MKEEELKEELLETYTRFYIEGFKTNNVKLIDQMFRYPITYIKEGGVSSRNHFPIDPKKLKKDIEWDHSINWKFDIPAINETSAHAVASATRCRKDGSIIENIQGFYAFTKDDDNWKMYVIADITY